MIGKRDACIVNIVCPLCGKSATLRDPLHASTGVPWHLRNDGTRGHEISASGLVSPSIVCPYKPCPWHVHGALDGWAATDGCVIDASGKV
jgi:hypothetical protein